MTMTKARCRSSRDRKVAVTFPALAHAQAKAVQSEEWERQGVKEDGRRFSWTLLGFPGRGVRRTG